MIAGAATRAGSLSRNHPAAEIRGGPAHVDQLDPVARRAAVRFDLVDADQRGRGRRGRADDAEVPVSVQSPSLTVSVTVETPAVVQVSVGFAVVAPASIPELATHE